MTIGIPVFNGEATITAALDSLLAQTFTDSEILISDNASTDATAAICQQYVRVHPQIVYQRLSGNVGAAANYRQVLGQARSPYFMWAAADDAWAPGFVGAHHEFLAANRDYVACQSRVLFTKSGKPSRLAAGTFALRQSPAQNATRFLAKPGDNSRFYGLYRTAALRAAFPSTDFYAFDWAVSAGTLRFGLHNELPEILMLRDETSPLDYLDTLDRCGGTLMTRALPLLGLTRHLLREAGISNNPSALFALAKLNVRQSLRTASYRAHRSASRHLDQIGAANMNLRPALTFLAHITAPGIGQRLANRRKANAIPSHGELPPKSSTAPEVSLVAVVQDQLPQLLELYGRLVASGESGRLALIIADAGSIDATQLVFGRRTDVVYLKFGRTEPFDAMQRAAAKAARGEAQVVLKPGRRFEEARI